MRTSEGPFVVPAPPPWAPGSGAGLSAALPALGGLGSIGLLAMAPRSPLLYVAGGLFLVTTMAMAVAGVRRAREDAREGRSAMRRRYLAELATARDTLRREADDLRARPGVEVLDDGRLGITLGRATIANPRGLVLDCPEGSDPFCRTRAEALVRACSAVPSGPVVVPVRTLTVGGSPVAVLGLLRAVACAVLTDARHDALRLAVLSDRPHEWAGLRWAPQHLHHTRSDASGPMRLTASTPAELAGLLADAETPVLLIDDRFTGPPAPAATWCLRRTGARDADVLVDDGRMMIEGMPVTDAVPATRGAGELDAAARRAAARAGTPSTGAPTAGGVSGPLRPVLGRGPAGEPLVLDIREPGEGGAGPHGLLIGATGSGKSELLRLLVCGLLERHDPGELCFAFVDFKGGATFAPFEGLPHVAASITNLEDDRGLVERAQAALAAELAHRQRVLRAHDVASIVDLPAGALSRLLVVVDEFSELLAQEPQMIDVLTQIGRLGRSLGVHLLISSQRLEEGRIKGLDSHLSYRIALRTQGAAESRAVIGVPDAAALPTPGHGYLQAGGAVVRFVADRCGAAAAAPVAEQPPQVHRWQHANGPETPRAHTADRETVLEQVIRRAARQPGRARPIWVAPPDRSPRLDELLDDLATRPGRGYGSIAGPGAQVPIGWVDVPQRQAIERYRLDLSGGRGHVGIVGATRAGTSTALRTLLLSLALRHTPEEAAFFVVDLSGGHLAGLAPLPHTATVATAAQPERVRAVIGHVAALVRSREDAVPPPTGAVYLAVDGLARLRADHEELDALVLDIARRGLRVGVHVLCTALRWLDVRAPLRDLLGTRLEMRLGDPSESEIDRAGASRVPRGRAGRGLSAEGRALYVADGDPDGVLIARIVAGWGGPHAAGPPTLPAVIALDRLPETVRGAGLCVAVDRASGGVIALGEEARYCLVLGDPGSGRTSVLRSLALQDARRGTRLIVLDPRRRLLGDLPPEALLGYAPAPAAAAQAVAGLATGLARRMPPADVDAERLAGRAWWSGPELHLLVDDYDLLTLGGGGLSPLRGFLPYAADIGLRISVARRAAGAGRALHDDVLSVLRDLGAVGLLLSAGLDDGPLLGVRPRPQPYGRGVLTAPGRPPREVQAIVAPRSAGG